MATIPTYQRQVSPNGLPDARAQQVSSADAYGSGAYQGLNTLAAGIDVHHEKQDAATVLAASNSFSNSLMDYFNGENGIFSRKGINAKGSFSESKKFVTDTINQYSSQLENDRQRQLFQQHTKLNSFNFLRDADSHERHEMDVETDRQFASSQKLSEQGMALNYANQPSFSGFLTKSENDIDTYGKIKGWDKETIELHKKAANTNGVKGAVGIAMEQNRTDIAESLLSTYKDKIDPVAWKSLDGEVRKIKQKNDDFLAADSIVKQATRADGSIYLAVAQNLLSKMYGPDKASGGSVSSGLDAGWKAWGNQHMDNGRVGCAEAVGKIGGYYSPFLAQEAQAGIAYVPTMVKHASQPGGPGVIPFDANKLQKGDCIVYGDDDHIVIADGNGGYVGNSSDANGGQGATVHGSDYTAMSGLEPTKIIKTGGDDSSAAFDAGRYKQVENLVHARIADNMRIKAQQDRDYRQQLSQQIDGAGSLSDALDVIGGANLPLQTKNALINAAKTKFKALATGDPNQKFFANYERNGLYRDMNVISEQQAMIEEGRDPTPAQSTKFSNAWYRVNRYNAFSKNGGYGGGSGGGDGGDADVAKSRYQEIMQDLWNSKTPEERKQKVRDNMAELNDLEQQLGVDANNDVSYIMSNGEE